MNSREMQAAIKRVVNEVTAVGKKLRGIHGGVRGIVAAAPDVVAATQRLGDEKQLAGSDKKAIATEAILILIPDSWLPDWALRPFVSWAIERAVTALKASGKFKPFS